jgi:hypothetical protein
MKTLIRLDPDSAAWGSECSDELASVANRELAKLLQADGYDVQMNTLSETVICAETQDDKDLARAAIDRHFVAALNAALALS